ncbi:protein-glutamate O-methyltransferase [Copidosoma floridanum]|uniref:protein-glutamate O-methyltransferase n=1 Tax=Copidosoma floridanum TaxID=29053 RepID=UPI0006C9CE5F|nr:protein-glutamate O-methyltransferase [Copidosoma floridanum]
MAKITQRSDSADISDLEDIEPPFDTYLRGKYKKSFAYATIKDRLPVILTKVIDTLSRNKDEIFKTHGAQAVEEIKQVVGGISKLKNELVTNKAILPLIVMSNRDNDDAQIWNDKIEKLTEERQETQLWFNTIWLICECYMYRRIAQEFFLTEHLKAYDPFSIQKEESFFKAKGSFSHLSKYVLNLIDTKNDHNIAEQEKFLINLIKLNLWGNKCDLSLSTGNVDSQNDNPLNLLESLDSDILIDNSNEVWRLLCKNVQCKTNNNSIVDIVLDNAGYELFTDLCLAIFLMENKLANKIRFYVKRYPWFVSDVTTCDFHWLVEMIKTSDDENIQRFGQVCDKYLKDKSWTIEEESFWTEPFDYSEMKSSNPSLYNKLSEAVLVIFKGDLNYRKLMGDVNWKYTTDFCEALRGFRPTNLLSLRTVKADVCVGLPAGKAEELKKEIPNWMEIGKFGLIQASIEIQ